MHLTLYLTGQHTVNPHLNYLLINEALEIRMADVSRLLRVYIKTFWFHLNNLYFRVPFFSKLSTTFSFCADNSSVTLTSLVFLSRLVAKVTDQNPRKGSSHRRRKSKNDVMSWRRRRRKKSLLLVQTAANTLEQKIPSNSRQNKPVRKFCQ